MASPRMALVEIRHTLTRCSWVLCRAQRGLVDARGSGRSGGAVPESCWWAGMGGERYSSQAAAGCYPHHFCCWQPPQVHRVVLRLAAARPPFRLCPANPDVAGVPRQGKPERPGPTLLLEWNAQLPDRAGGGLPVRLSKQTDRGAGFHAAHSASLETTNFLYGWFSHFQLQSPKLQIRCLSMT